MVENIIIILKKYNNTQSNVNKSKLLILKSLASFCHIYGMQHNFTIHRHTD